LSTETNLKKLAELFYSETNNEYDLVIFPDHLDDSNWNDGDGISGICDDEEFYRNISKKFGNIAFTVHIYNEDDNIDEYRCRCGNVDEINLGNVFEQFMEADTDCDFEDFEFEPYHILYGGTEKIPAGFEE